jgi:hypothetical protein
MLGSSRHQGQKQPDISVTARPALVSAVSLPLWDDNLCRELDRLELLLEQIKGVEAERDALLNAEQTKASAPPPMLLGVRGVGPEFASVPQLHQSLSVTPVWQGNAGLKSRPFLGCTPLTSPQLGEAESFAG